MRFPSPTWRRRIGVGLCGTSALWVACATPSPVVDQVRSELTSAEQDPDVVKYAAVPLHEARLSFQRLERADDDPDGEIEHRAYVARRRIEIARAAGEAGALESRREELAEERDELRLRARSVEAEQAKEEAEEAREQAASAIERAEELEVELSELKAEETERGVVLTMSDVLFAFDRADLEPGAEHALVQVARFLNEYPERRIAVEGHTDNVGSSGYNEELSQRRAASVARYLEQHGVDRQRIQVAGHGEALPVAPNESEAGRQQNRRVEIVLAKETPPAVGLGR